MPGTILIADDDATARALMTAVVEAVHLEPAQAADGAEALEKAAEGVDLVLLDMNLPRLNGLEVCRRLRRDGYRTPIIMVTARTATVDVVVALEVGADDYVRKPFHPRELSARIASQLRSETSARASRSSSVLTFPGLTIDAAKRQVWREGVEVDLTHTEFASDTAWASTRSTLRPYQVATRPRSSGAALGQADPRPTPSRRGEQPAQRWTQLRRDRHAVVPPRHDEAMLVAGCMARRHAPHRWPRGRHGRRHVGCRWTRICLRASQDTG